MINISFQTKSPLCQIDKTEDATSVKNSIIRVKKQKVFVENKHGQRKALSVPIYTGNGFRGMLRRETMAVMLEAVVRNAENKITQATEELRVALLEDELAETPAEKEDASVAIAKAKTNKTLAEKESEKTIATPEDYHLMNAGGGNLYQEQPFDVEDSIRELNPQISIFGASLAIKGKLRVSNFIPLEKDESGEVFYQFHESSEGNAYSSILADTTVIVRDGILDRDKNSQYLTREQIEEWLVKSDANIKARAKDREEKDKKTKTKKQTIRGAIDREYVAVGVDFFGGISEREKLTSIEKGLLVMGIERAILNNLGSTSANDFGKVNYTIEIDKDSKLKTEVNEYGKCEITSRYYSDELNTCISDTKEFLTEITRENLEITKILVSK